MKVILTLEVTGTVLLSIGSKKLMYLDNPKKLFKDLYNLPTMYCYMVACAEDGDSEKLQSLFSIVSCNRGELHEGGEGSERWNLENCETEKRKTTSN